MLALGSDGSIHLAGVSFIYNREAWFLAPLMFLGGMALLLMTLHGARAVGRVHALIAKHLLVQA